MSLFSWFTRKPASAQPRMAEPSGLLNADATVPMTPGRDGRPVAPAAPTEHAANRKNERMERRELLYAVVRDAMVRAAVLSASYKFKVLSLDQRGRQFLVMMDLASEYGGDTARLSEIEALIAQTAKSRYDISVNAVYWRLNDHVAVGVPLQGVPPARTPAAAQPRPAVSPARAQAAAAAAPAEEAEEEGHVEGRSAFRSHRSRRGGCIQAGPGVGRTACGRGVSGCAGALRPHAFFALAAERFCRHRNA